MSKTKKEAADIEPVKARTLLDRSMYVIEQELAKIAEMSRIGQVIPLDPEYMNALLGITKTLVAVDKNENDNPSDEDDLSGLSMEEIRAKVKDIMKDDKK